MVRGLSQNRQSPVQESGATIGPKGRGCQFGLFKNDPLLIDDDAFDALDDEIAQEFGV